MKKGIARLGLICSISLFAQPVFASTVSDLLISEIMSNPAALPDSGGEWFELYNPTDVEFNLRGLEIGDDGGNRHRFDSDLLILPGEYLTLARSANPGFTPGYVYDDFTLSNGSDEIVLRDGPLELLRLDYGPGFSVAGRSRELIHAPMVAANYELALLSLGYGAGDFGTPGSGNLAAPAISAVPLPAAAWLFASAVLAIFSPALRRFKTASAGVTGLRA